MSKEKGIKEASRGLRDRWSVMQKAEVVLRLPSQSGGFGFVDEYVSTA